MSEFLKKVARGELPGQRKSSNSPSGSRGGRSPSDDESSSSGGGSTGREIPPEPVQLATDGDFSIAEAQRPLQVHNLARASKLSKALEWDTQLAKDARAYAQTLASTGILERSGIETAGENLYRAEGDVQLEDAVDVWLNQEKKYNGEAIVTSGTGLQEWGYFTQCVWQNTLYVGMGRAKAPDGTTYVVARYSPRGNVEGEMPYKA